MVQSNASPEKESYLLVRFFYGEGGNQSNRYTDWTQDTQGHVSVPQMKVEVPENTATFDQKALRIILPIDTFTDRLSNGTPFSPTFVVVEEVTQGLKEGDQNAFLTLWKGRITRTIRNYQGKANRVAIFSLLRKGRLQISMGLPCNHHCANTVFSTGCGLSVTGFERTVTIDSANGKEVTITTGDAPTLGDNRYWQKGYMEKDGIRISIRDYNRAVDGTKFYMARRIPTDWVGANDIRCVPGCDKTVETCRSRYNNEQGQDGAGGFAGYGYAIPSYQPNIQSCE